jgi:TolB protein
MRPDGTEVAPVTTDPAVDTVPAWFPDGKTLVYRSDRLGRPTLWRFDLASKTESLLLEPSRDMDWVRLSPDGRTIAFNSSSGSGAVNVWLSGLDGQDARQLTYDSEFMGFPCWAPDGRQLAVQIKRGENAQIALVPREGGAPVVLTRDEGQAWPYSFSPDGRSVAFAGLRGGFWNVYAVSVDTREERRLTSLDQINAYVRYPAWSPRGNRLVYEYAETSGNVWMVELAQ